MLTQSMAVEWAVHEIRVNSISPGYMNTEMTLSSMAPLFPAWEALTPMRRLGEPAELRGALLFLASHASSCVTGHDLAVDCGYTVHWPPKGGPTRVWLLGETGSGHPRAQ